MDALATHHLFGDFRPRASGVLAVGRGESVTGVASVLGVTVQSVRNGKLAWREAGLVGLLRGHAGGRPLKLTEAMLDTAVAAATAEPLGLWEIADRGRAAHPEAPPFSLDRLGARLKGRGLSFKRCRLSLKKKETRSGSRPPGRIWPGPNRRRPKAGFACWILMNRALPRSRTCSGRGHPPVNPTPPRPASEFHAHSATDSMNIRPPGPIEGEKSRVSEIGFSADGGPRSGYTDNPHSPQ